MRANEAFFFLSLGDLIQYPISSFLHLFISVLWFCFSLQLSRAPLRVSVLELISIAANSIPRCGLNFHCCLL